MFRRLNGSGEEKRRGRPKDLSKQPKKRETKTNFHQRMNNGIKKEDLKKKALSKQVSLSIQHI
jgi:hypothetical protein